MCSKNKKKCFDDFEQTCALYGPQTGKHLSYPLQNQKIKTDTELGRYEL